jgi:hypothetical protein
MSNANRGFDNVSNGNMAEASVSQVIKDIASDIWAKPKQLSPADKNGAPGVPEFPTAAPTVLPNHDVQAPVSKKSIMGDNGSKPEQHVPPLSIIRGDEQPPSDPKHPIPMDQNPQKTKPAGDQPAPPHQPKPSGEHAAPPHQPKPSGDHTAPPPPKPSGDHSAQTHLHIPPVELRARPAHGSTPSPAEKPGLPTVH